MHKRELILANKRLKDRLKLEREANQKLVDQNATLISLVRALKEAENSP